MSLDTIDPFAGAPDEGAMWGLLLMMTGISEQNWCAGWMMGLEYSLWRVEPGTRFGMDLITERQATLLRLLSEEADGWWIWDDDPKFLSMQEWLKRLEAVDSARVVREGGDG